MARLARGQQVHLIDLPGIYSLHPRSEDEQITHDVLTGGSDLPRPDAIILILDSTSLQRHLALAGPIIALGISTLVALNMADELKARGGGMDANALAERLGTPVVLISARRGHGIEAVQEFLEGTLGVPPPVQLPVLQNVAHRRQWAAEIGHRSGYRAPAPPVWTRRLDALFLHPIAGPAIFALVVLLVFQSIFTAATPLMDGIKQLVAGSGHWLSATLPDSWIKDLLVDGVWTGVGSVIVFLPQILILFLFIGILEDSGYLARAAVIADRTMSKIGLQGKSFIPLLSAYACAVPAIMATRTIESKRDRIATILIAPFMTCSARLPVYVLVIAAFLPERRLLGPFLGTRAAAMIGLYVIGFVAAVLTAWALKSSILKSSRRTPFMPRDASLPPAQPAIAGVASLRPFVDLSTPGRNRYSGHDDRFVVLGECADPQRRAAADR